MEALLAGTISGSLSTIAGQPFDLIRVRMQKEPARYRGVLNAMQQVLKQEQVKGLYRGTTAALTVAALENGVLFAANSVLTEEYKKIMGRRDPLNVYEQAGLGGVAGIFSSIAIAPPELIKIRMQADMLKSGGERKYKGVIDCVLKTIRSENGVFTLFRSLPAQISRDVPFCFSFFGAYAASTNFFILGREYFQNKTEFTKKDLSPFEIVLSGGLAGCFGWLTSMPMDNIKTHSSTSTHKITSTRELFVSSSKEIYTKYGMKGFFRGYKPIAIRAFAVNAVLFLTYENISRVLVDPL